MEFVCFTDWNQLPESANALFARYEKESLFFSRPWFENLVDTALEENQSMLLACVVENNRVLAILPLMRESDDSLQSLCHLYSSLYTLLLVENKQPETLACLTRGLSQLSFKTLSLKPFDKNDKSIDRLQLAMEAAGFSCYRGFRFYNWIYQVRGESFADYMAKRPGKLRNTIARKQRKFEREHGYEIRLFTDEGVEQALSDYTAAYNASWKAHELFGVIIEGMVSRFSSLGWLRLAILYVNKQPVAAQLWFVVDKKASIFRLAYDEAWKQYSPGTILTKYLMEYVIDTDKVDEIDFLTGNERYKQDWMSKRRERWGMTCEKSDEPKELKRSSFFESVKNMLNLDSPVKR